MIAVVADDLPMIRVIVYSVDEKPRVTYLAQDPGVGHKAALKTLLGNAPALSLRPRRERQGRTNKRVSGLPRGCSDATRGWNPRAGDQRRPHRSRLLPPWNLANVVAMKSVWIGLVVLVAGCGDPLKHDVEMFCNAVVGSNAKSFMDIGPYVAEHALSTEFKTMLQKTIGGGLTIWELADQVRGWMKEKGVTRCKTLDVIVRPRPVAPALAVPSAWVLYIHPDKLMSVRFPAEPTEREQEAPSAIGPTRVKLAIFNDDKRTYIATAVTFPATSKFSVKGALDGGRDQALANIKGKAVSEKPMKLDGFEGREVVFEAYTPNNHPIRGAFRIFTWAKPPSAFVATALWITSKDQSDPDAQKFLDSIRLGKNVEIKR